MTSEAFLSRLNAISPDKRSAFSQTALKLGKLAAAEAVGVMLEDEDFGVRVNAIKTIRHFELDIYEKSLIRLLLDDENEVRVAALKSLCSFGKADHFKLARAFYDENPSLRALVIDSFVNFSDRYEAHAFIFQRLDASNEKIRRCAIDWFEKAFDRDIFLPWIAQVYEESAWSLRLTFEELFAHRLKLLFSHARYGYRFKLVWLNKRIAK
jgi:HEAT repeat protein